MSVPLGSIETILLGGGVGSVVSSPFRTPERSSTAAPRMTLPPTVSEAPVAMSSVGPDCNRLPPSNVTTFATADSPVLIVTIPPGGIFASSSVVGAMPPDQFAGVVIQSPVVPVQVRVVMNVFSV
jgi:hypothetical protein